MVESADTAGLNPVAKRRAGSSPARDTNYFLLKWRNWQTRCAQTADAEGSNPSLRTSFSPGDGMAYVLVLETKFWEFESPLGHHFRKIGTRGLLPLF